MHVRCLVHSLCVCVCVYASNKCDLGYSSLWFWTLSATHPVISTFFFPIKSPEVVEDTSLARLSKQVMSKMEKKKKKAMT